MKNTFRFLGIALLASSMLFVACKDDDDPEEVQAAADGVNVEFGAKKWAAQTYQVAFDGTYVTFLAYEKTGAYDNLLVKFKANKEKSYTDELQVDADGVPESFKKANIETIKYYTKAYNTADEGEPEEIDANWWGKTVTIDITTLDADNGKFTATISATLFDYEEWQTSDVTVETASTKNLSVIAKNVPLANVQVNNDAE